jgi:hypothetical protein
MVSGVRAVQIKGREFTKEVVWCPPNLHMRLSCNSNISRSELQLAGATGVDSWAWYSLPIGRELDRSNGIMKVEVM